MSPYAYALPCSAVLLETLLLWRLSRNQLGYRYPFLTLYVFYIFIRDMGLFPIVWFLPRSFSAVYWRTEMIAVFLRFFINWEFFRGIFPRHSSLYELGWKAWLTVELIALPAVFILTWNQRLSTYYLHPYVTFAIEQYLSLAQAFLLLVPAMLARYYGMILNRMMRGIGLGFGVYLAASALNFATVQILGHFPPYGQILLPATFIGMLGVWLQAIWKYAPSGKHDEIPRGASVEWNASLQSRWNHPKVGHRT